MELPHLQLPSDDASFHYCFGCGELNPIGLHLKPAYDGERVTATFTPGRDHQGWNQVTHGGIVYSVLDEITAYMVLCAGYSFGVTAKSVVRFKRVTPTGMPLTATARATRVTSRLIEVQGKLSLTDGTILAEVDSIFIPGERYGRAFIWDMDGVLVDSAAPHYESWRRVFASQGCDYGEDQFRSNFGMRDDQIIELVMGNLPDKLVESIAEEKEHIYRDIVRSGARIFPGVLPLLRAMRKGQFHIALGTSAPMANVKAVLPQLGLSDYFPVAVCGEDVRKGKPDPEIYLLAAERLGADAAQCIVFEDSPHGVEAAKRAGMKCVAITNTHPAHSLRGADRVISSCEEIDLVQLLRWI